MSLELVGGEVGGGRPLASEIHYIWWERSFVGSCKMEKALMKVVVVVVVVVVLVVVLVVHPIYCLSMHCVR